MLDQRIWVVIPAYNEEKNISKVLEDLKKITSNILVVDDGSEDNTLKICQNKGVLCVSHKINRGQGAALQTGDELALELGAEVIVHFDADGQMQTEDILKVALPVLRNECDICLGSRFLGPSFKIPWTKRYFILKPAILFNWIFTGIKLTDAHCGFRALGRKAAEVISLRQNGMAHGTEIIEQIYENKLKYKEVPVNILYHEYGQGFRDGFKIIKEIILSRLLK